MESSYISFSKCIHVVLNGQKLPDLPCTHHHNCGMYHGLVHVCDTKHVHATFEPNLPVRVGAFPIRFDVENNDSPKPQFFAAPGLEINVVIQRQGGPPVFLQRTSKLPLQGFLNLSCDKTLVPGAYTVVIQKGTYIIRPASNTVRAVRYIEMSPGSNILHGLIVESDTQYVISCLLPFLFSPHEVAIDEDSGIGEGSMSYYKAIALVNL